MVFDAVSVLKKRPFVTEETGASNTSPKEPSMNGDDTPPVTSTSSTLPSSILSDDFLWTLLHPEWQSFLSNDKTIIAHLANVSKFLNEELKKGLTIYPPMSSIMSWSHLTLPRDVRVVIVGQDPYHGPGQAHGLAFSISNTKSTGSMPRMPPSLTNILTEVTSNGYKSSSTKDNSLYNLERWAKQGVLLLNTVLTVRAGQATSHSNQGIWEPFTRAIVKHLLKQKRPLIFMCWGLHAKRHLFQCIDEVGRNSDAMCRHVILTAAHPSPLSANRHVPTENSNSAASNNKNNTSNAIESSYGKCRLIEYRQGFFGCRHFRLANELIEKLGLGPSINW